MTNCAKKSLVPGGDGRCYEAVPCPDGCICDSPGVCSRCKRGVLCKKIRTCKEAAESNYIAFATKTNVKMYRLKNDQKVTVDCYKSGSRFFTTFPCNRLGGCNN